MKDHPTGENNAKPRRVPEDRAALECYQSRRPDRVQPPERPPMVLPMVRLPCLLRLPTTIKPTTGAAE